MAEEKWDLNSKIYDWFDSVLSDDNILKRDFLTDLSHSATFADVIIGVAEYGRRGQEGGRDEAIG